MLPCNGPSTVQPRHAPTDEIFLPNCGTPSHDLARTIHSTMPQVIKRFSRLSALDLVARCLFIEARLQGNAAFLSLAAALLVVATKRKNLEAAITAAADGGRTVVALREKYRRELKLELDKLAAGVASIAGDDEALILGAGFFVRNTSRSTEGIPMPLKLRARISEHTGEARLDWGLTQGASIYAIEHNGVSPDDASAWKHVVETTRIKHVISGLASATVHWFRVRAIGTQGRSPWSDVAYTLVR